MSAREAAGRAAQSEWWRCPNEPPCEHAGLFHDVEDFEGNNPMCCIDGCRCGKPAAAPGATT